MSKASEWARRESDCRDAVRSLMSHRPRPVFTTLNAGQELERASLTVFAADRFFLDIGSNRFTPREALALADWIKEHFADPPAPEGA